MSPAFQRNPESLYAKILDQLGGRAQELEPEVWRLAIRGARGRVREMSRWLGVTRSYCYMRIQRFELGEELRRAQAGG